MSKPDPVLTIEIVRFDDGTYYAAASKGVDVFFGITHSPKNVPDLLRNTADALEKIHEVSPRQFPQLFNGREQS